MNTFGTCLLCASALFFAFTTLLSAIRPGEFAGRLGLSIVDPGGTNEIRSQYAGFFLAAAVACVAAVAGYVPRSASYLLLGTIFGGLMTGRVVAIAANRGTTGYGPTIVGLVFVDLLGFIAAAAMMTAGPA